MATKQNTGDCITANAGVSGPTDQPTLRRITACVNACDGIATDLLEGFSPGFLASRPDEHLKVRQQRDELIEALRLIADEVQVDEAVFIARTLLARVEAK